MQVTIQCSSWQRSAKEGKPTGVGSKKVDNMESRDEFSPMLFRFITTRVSLTMCISKFPSDSVDNSMAGVKDALVMNTRRTFQNMVFIDALYAVVFVLRFDIP